MGDPAGRWPYLTTDLDGCGGTIRRYWDDFQVEEVPLYTPSGSGTHLYLLIEKEGLPTFEAVTKLARALKRNVSEFGVAGLKDAMAVTRQFVSIEHVNLSELPDLHDEGIRILDARLHGNKLKTGHLKGNRFRIRIRDTVLGSLEKARAVLSRLEERGLPNFFGPQRFGRFGNTHLLGEALIHGDYKGFVDTLICTPRTGADPDYGKVIAAYRCGAFAEALSAIGRTFKYERRVLEILVRHPGRYDRAVKGTEKRMLRFYFSAFQSHYFNKCLEARIDGIDRIEQGDIAFIHRNGAAFLVENPKEEAGRVQAFEISPSGPVFGKRMLKAQGNPGLMEAELLKECGLELDEITGGLGIRLHGARRPLRVPLKGCECKKVEGGLALSFFLPPGAYATVVLREVMKEEGG